MCLQGTAQRERKPETILRMGFKMGSSEELSLAGVGCYKTLVLHGTTCLGEKYVDTYRRPETDSKKRAGK